MSTGQVEVFYVTAVQAGNPAAKRTELAKFFDQTNAENHVKKVQAVGTGWLDVKVEPPRMESMAAQHPAHRPG